jgi:hypothetical protein
MTYMIGAMRGNDDKDDHNYVTCYDELRYTIIQPRHPEAPPGGVGSETKTPAELMAFKDRLQEGVDRVYEAIAILGKTPTLQALHDASYLSPGQFGEACTFCPLKATVEYGAGKGKKGPVISCPALMRVVEMQAGIDFSQDTLEGYQDGPDSQKINQEGLKTTHPPEELATLLPWLPIIEAWAKDVRKVAEGRLLQGDTIPGFKVVEKKGKRSWRADLTEDQIVKQLTKEFKMSKKDLFEPPRLLTGPKVEKLLDKEARKNFNAKMLENSPHENVVAPESDRRPAVIVRPGQEFENV